MQCKIKRVLQIAMYTTKITTAFFLGNGNQIILFLSWQLFVFISLAMQKYSKRMLTGTIYSGAPAARRAAKWSPILIWERKGNP